MTPFLGTYVNIFNSKVVFAKNCQIVQQEKNMYKNMYFYIETYSYMERERTGKQMGLRVNIWYVYLKGMFVFFLHSPLS